MKGEYMKKYLNEMMKDVQLENNMLIVSPAGSGKTHYIINELCNDKKVLYLCDNNNLEEQVSLENNTRVVKKNEVKKGFNRTDIHIMTYKLFGKKVKYDFYDTYINQFDLIVADEVHNLVDYQTFNNDADLSHAIRSLMKTYSNTQILMFTATPYYLDQLAKENPGIDSNFCKIDFSNSRDIMRYINKREAYINHMSQIQFALEEYKQSFEYRNMKCLIYANKIDDMKFIENICIEKNLKPICLWSKNNKDYELSDEQRRVRRYLIGDVDKEENDKKGTLIDPYNVLIINRATETGVNIYDKDMQLVIVNTVNVTQRIQARGRVRHDVDLLIIKTRENNKVNTITIEEWQLNKWLLKEDLVKIIINYELRDVNGKYITANKLNKYLSSSNYKVNKSRKTLNGKKDTYYQIVKFD